MKQLITILSFVLFAVMGVALGHPVIEARSKTATSSLIRVSVEMKQQKMLVGQETQLVTSIKNSLDKAFRDDEFFPYVWEKGKGERRKTILHRRMRHEPGLEELMVGGPPQARECPPGETTIRRYDLSKYYDLSTPGKYFVYMEYLDETGKWSHSNTVQFEIQAPAH